MNQNLSTCDFILKDGTKHKGFIELIRYLIKKEVEKQLKERIDHGNRINNSRNNNN